MQTITVTVSERPTRGGIDPYNLLDWEEGDNIETIEMEEREECEEGGDGKEENKGKRGRGQEPGGSKQQSGARRSGR